MNIFRPNKINFTGILTGVLFFLNFFSGGLLAQGPELILEEDHFRMCEGDLAVVEITITGTPDVWYYLEYEGETTAHASNTNTFRVRLSDPGMYVITEYGDNTTPGADPADTFYIELFPAPEVDFTGGGVNCSGGLLDPLVVHFSGEPDFRFHFLFNGVLDSMETRRTDITFPTDQSFTIEAVSLEDNNCKLDVDASASYVFIDVPVPQVEGDTLVCEGDTRVYRPEVGSYYVGWNLPQGVVYDEGFDDEGFYLNVFWDEPGFYPVMLRYIEDEYGCETEWGSLVVMVSGIPSAVDADTTLCFELDDVLEVNLPTGEDELVYWPELNLEGGQIILNAVGIYTHIHINEYGCSDTARIRVTSDCEPQLHVPEAFTPNNGDQLNDVLTLYGLFSSLDFRVYSPSGILLFQTTEDPLIFWDGTYEGHDMPPGSYYWSAVFSEGDGDPIESTGIVTIIK
ncbi:MAG: gliding motility-associated C-terminal domain-containing protein [Bacteroidales bacterium]|nr:gliding motility-associated C-terminal domain-containing protein [Bacteroidales bacterium]